MSTEKKNRLWSSKMNVLNPNPQVEKAELEEDAEALTATIKIEKGIPIPEPRNRRTRRYPLLDMEVGDSFFIPTENKVIANSLRSSIGNSAKVNKLVGRKFTTRVFEDGLRVWRIL